jgi:hypothetical protein
MKRLTSEFILVFSLLVVVLAAALPMLNSLHTPAAARSNSPGPGWAAIQARSIMTPNTGLAAAVEARSIMTPNTGLASSVEARSIMTPNTGLASSVEARRLITLGMLSVGVPVAQQDVAAEPGQQAGRADRPGSVLGRAAGQARGA